MFCCYRPLIANLMSNTILKMADKKNFTSPTMKGRTITVATHPLPEPKTVRAVIQSWALSVFLNFFNNKK